MFYKNLYTIIPLTFSLLFYALKTQAQPPLRFELLSIENGLSQHEVWSILRDKNGFLWIGTLDGLNRYDGHQFTVYRKDLDNTKSLTSPWALSLAEESENMLWVGTDDGLNRLNTITNEVEQFKNSANDTNSISNNFVRDVLVDEAGLIWAGTENGLNAFDYRTKKFQRFFYQPGNPDSIGDNSIQCIYEDKKENLWIGTRNGLKNFNRKSKKFIQFVNQPGNLNCLPGTNVRCITQDRDGILWIGTEGKGLAQFDPFQQKFIHYTHHPADDNSLSSDLVYGIVEDDQGILWVTTGSGLNLFDKKRSKFTRYSLILGDKKSLYADYLSKIYKDNEGIIWIGSALGLRQYNPRSRFFYHYIHNDNDKNSLSDNNVFPILEDRDGILWIGTAGGGLNCFDRNNNKWTHYKFKNGDQYSKNGDPYSPGNNWVWGLSEGRNGKLWIATNIGLDCMDKKTGRFIHYTHNDDTSSLSGGSIIRNLWEDRAGNIWVSSDDGLNKLNVHTGKFQHFRYDPKNRTTLSSNFPSCISEDRNGNIWVGTFGDGLNKYDPAKNSFKRFVHIPLDSNSINNNNIFCIHEDKQGKLWLGGDMGIDCFNPETGIATHYREKDGLPNETVHRIEEDRQELLWISTNKGLIRFDPKTGQFKYFDTRDGLQSLAFNIYSSEQSKRTGEMFFGGVNGFNIFHPDSIDDNTYKPGIIITKLRRFNAGDQSGKPVDENMIKSKSVTLSYRENMLSFEFVSLSLYKPSKNQYAYQLKGFSDQWYQLGTTREVTFTGLSPGNYTLRVKGSNGDGIWNNTPTDLSITILPPWWRTGWAYAFYALCFLAGVFAVHKFQQQRLIRKERERAREKELEQAKEIDKAYHKLEQTHEELKATQTQLIHSEKMASLGELTAGIAHEIQNPLNFVNNFSDVNKELLTELKDEIKKGNTVEANAIADDVIDNEEKINHHGKRADAIVKGMLQHSKTSTGIKEPTDINKLADEYLRLSYHGMRAKDKSFEVKIKTDLDESVGKVKVVSQDIARVLLNLFNNAFYAVNERRETADETYQPTVSVVTKKLNGEIEIKVNDNGTGIPQNIVDKIFQPFFTTKPTGQGTGLGLSLAYDIITKQHNGTIKVESKPGEGSVFVILIPV